MLVSRKLRLKVFALKERITTASYFVRNSPKHLQGIVILYLIMNTVINSSTIHLQMAWAATSIIIQKLLLIVYFIYLLPFLKVTLITFFVIV